MPDFTQWTVPTPFTNVLYNPMAVDKAANDAETARQTIGANDIAMVGRAAGSLLNMSESDAAAAYPGMIADLQRQGFARNAPSEYPGHAAVQGLVQRGLTVPEQYNSGLLTAPGVTDALKAASAPLSFGNSGVVTGGGGAGGPRASDAVGGDQIANAKAIHAGLVARGMDNETALAMSANLLGESGGNWQTNPGDGGASHGIAQWNKERLAAFQAANGGKLPAQTNLDAQLDFLTKEWKADHNGAATAAGQFGTAEGKIAPIVSKYEVSANQPADIARRSAYLNQLRAAGIGAGGGTAVATAPINPNAGPRVGTLPPPPVAATAPAIAPARNPNAPVQIPPPVQTSQVPVTPSPVAARTGGTDVAGPGAGPDTTLPAVPQPNQMYQTGLAGVTMAAPGNALAPPAQTAAAAPPPPVTQPSAAPAAAPQPRTGQNSPQFQAAMELNRRAQALDMVVDPTGRTKALAASLRAQAALYMQADSVTYDPRTGIGTKAITGEQVSPAKPLPHYVYDPNQHAFIDTTGTNKPEFQPAQRDSAVAQRDVMELGPKVANGTATPEEQARYATAVETYRDPTLRENPVTKETVRVNKRELPAGFPEPPGLGGTGPGNTGGPQVVMPGYSPAQQQVERDPAAYKVAESQYDRDSKEIGAIGDVGRQAQADQVRIKEMQDVLQRFSTGSGTEARTAASNWLQRWLPAGVTGWEKESANLTGSDAAQAFSKMALVGAGTQERGVLGARGGYQAIRLFKEANPNVNLQDATNKSILDMQLISNQANQDYSQSALSHFADNETKFGQTHKYDSLAQFDRDWNSQRNPQVYAAAMGAISGQPPTQWAKGLSDAEYKRALDIVSRANPSAVVNSKSGPISMQPTSTSATPTPPAVGTVQDGFRFKGGNPASPTSWEAVVH